MTHPRPAVVRGGLPPSPPRLLLLLGLLGACSPKSDDSGTTNDECPGSLGLPEGVPSPTGDWTSFFAQDFYDDTCSAADLDQDSETWIGSMTIAGNVPEAMYLYFDGALTADTERFMGAMDANGGVSFTGHHAHSAGQMTAQFGGLVYHDQYRDYDIIDGTAFLGLDVEGDGTIDCNAKGSWVALKSSD